MALANKIGNLFKKVTTSNLSMYQAIRCMSSSKVFVGGLSYGTDDQSLGDAFTSFGEVVEARVINDRETGRSRGFGFVTFTSSEEASSAISGMDGKDLHGRMIRVNYATERTGFRGGGGGGGGYGGGGGGGYGGGSSGYGGSAYGGGEGYGGGAGGYGGGGSYGSGGGYGGGNTGGYGGSSGGEGYSVSGGGGSDYVSGASCDSGVSGGAAAGVYGGSSAADNGSSADAGLENVSQEDLLDDNFKVDDDEPDSYANKQS